MHPSRGSSLGQQPPQRQQQQQQQQAALVRQPGPNANVQRVGNTTFNGAVLTGVLIKRGGLIKTWKARFFSMNTRPVCSVELRPYIDGRMNITKQMFTEIKDSISSGAGLVFYYKTALTRPEDVKGVINLRDCDGVLKHAKGVHGTREYPYSLEILVPKQRSFVIATSSTAEQDIWAQKIQEVVKEVTEAYLILRKFATNTNDAEDPDSFIWA